MFFLSSSQRLWLQRARLHEASQSHLEAEKVDQDPGGEDQAAAQVLPHWGEMSLPQQFLCTDRRGGDPWGIPYAQTDTLLHQDCKVQKGILRRMTLHQPLARYLVYFILCELLCSAVLCWAHITVYRCLSLFYRYLALITVKNLKWQMNVIP